MMFEFRMKDIVCLVVVVVSIINAQLFDLKGLPLRLRWVPWTISIISIIALFYAITGHCSPEVLFVIGSEK